MCSIVGGTPSLIPDRPGPREGSTSPPGSDSSGGAASAGPRPGPRASVPAESRSRLGAAGPAATGGTPPPFVPGVPWPSPPRPAARRGTPRTDNLAPPRGRHQNLDRTPKGAGLLAQHRPKLHDAPPLLSSDPATLRIPRKRPRVGNQPALKMLPLPRSLCTM